MKEMIRVAVAEDGPSSREKISHLLRDMEDLQFVYTAPNGGDLVKWLKRNMADVILIDLNLNPEESHNTVSTIEAMSGKAKVIIISEYKKENHVTLFVAKNGRDSIRERSEKLAEAIRRVFKEGVQTEPVTSNLPSRKASLSMGDAPREKPRVKFSAKEITVLRYMCEGKQSKEIAALMQKAIKTIENHRSDIWRKSGCNTLPDLIDFAFKHGLITF